MPKNGRHEHKIYIHPFDQILLCGRLQHLARPDAHSAEKGFYKIRSLYFDNYQDKAVTEKLSGQSRREKFRIRYYDDDASFIRLEKKSKANRLCYKESVTITQAQCEDLLAGRWDWMQDPSRPLLLELYTKMQYQLLRPKTIVDYQRRAFVYGPGNVRITFDTHIRASSQVEGLFNADLATLPAARGQVLEIKYDGFLPEILRQALQLENRKESEFSKYVVARHI